jgi:hypothetical protein
MRIGQKIRYLVSGLTGRMGTQPICPACQSKIGVLVDRKWFHSLIECERCGLLHRFPVESVEFTASFYEAEYAAPGLTTELPSPEELKELMEKEFKGSEKDYSYHAAVLDAVGVPTGGRLLDYGANWGYASWQFARRGFEVTSFEISKPRATYGAKLGLKIHSDISQVGTGFDAVYSCHVLEHTLNPRDVLLRQLSLVKPGGLVVAHTPNGSVGYRKAAGREFSAIWGFVHPVLLTERFVSYVAGPRPFFVSSNDRPENVSRWNRKSQVVQSTDDAGFFFAIRRTS